MMLIRVRNLGEFGHSDWHIVRASLRPLCGHQLFQSQLRVETQTAEIDYARVIGGISLCGICLFMLVHAVEDATRDCNRHECFISNVCACVTSALEKGISHDPQEQP
jgi:hypothetical protein